MTRPLLAALVLALGASHAGAQVEAHYTLADYAKVPKIDSHMHLHNPEATFIEAARAQNFKVLTINVDYPDFPPLDEQFRVAVALHTVFPSTVAFAGAFPVTDFESAGWLERTQRRIDGAMAAGAVGIKVWKNVGMSLRDAQGKLVMLDDLRLKPVFDYMEAKGITLLDHQGEPYNCWLPLDKMSVNNDREYFKAHPQYHMYLHPEMPSWEDQMAARDRMLDAHPKLHFVGMHMASLERDVDELAAFLDRYPGASVDVAARIGQIQSQGQQDREKMRRFFIKYQDRLLYATDIEQEPTQPGAEMAHETGKAWREQWRYFTSADTFKVADLDKPVKGLALPRGVIDKLYHLNAERTFKGGWGSSQ
ncbi:MAG: amidohydrolase family protein [Caulobacter sp.]|nr:amidohydrolase family protein [Vitreoscilla sp.]